MAVTVKKVKDVANNDNVVGFISKEGGRGRLFAVKDTVYNLPKANGAPVQVVAPLGEDIVDSATPDGKGPFYLNLTYDPASPDAGSNGRFLITDGSYVIVADNANGT